jgi:hypothetical protein
MIKLKMKFIKNENKTSRNVMSKAVIATLASQSPVTTQTKNGKKKPNKKRKLKNKRQNE